jgi:cysteinyl-tRNA synthetase
MDTDLGQFAKAVLNFKMRFMEAMDDDFNTAGAISVMHELAGEINGLIEQRGLERDKQPDVLKAAVAAAMTLRKLTGMLGLMRRVPGRSSSESRDSQILAQVMNMLIQMRQDARRDKNFALADGLRDGLAKIGITLEDRADGTGWKKE